MPLGIDVKVDSKQVKDARKEIEVFNRSLTAAQKQSTIELGVGSASNLEETATLLTKIREQVSRIGELSRAATNRGGILRKEQFVEAGDLAKRVQTDLGKWSSEIDKAREALKRLQAEKNQIGRDFMMGRVAPQDMQAKMDRESTIEAEEKAARDRLAYMEKQQARLRPLEDRARQYSDVLSRSGTDPDNQGRELSMKKALGFALAAAGGFSIMSFLSQSRGKYQEFAGHENILAARGLTGVLDGGATAAKLGIDPMEHFALQEQLTRSMGLSGNAKDPRLARMTRNTELFSRYYGLSTSEVAGFGASVYQGSGARGMGASALIALQQQGIEKTRMPETMRLMEGHLRTMSEARRGAGLTEGNVATALALAAAAIREGRPEASAYLKSGNLANTLQNGLQGAGSPAGEIAIFNAIGGFKGPMTFGKIHDMNLLRQGGFMEHPELLGKVLQNMPKGLDRAGRAGWLETMFPQWVNGRSAELFLDLYEKGGLNSLKRTKLGGSDAAAQAAMLKDITANPATSKLVRQALMTQLEIQTGGGIDAIVDPLQTRLLQGSNAALTALAEDIKRLTGGEPVPQGTDFSDSRTGLGNRMMRAGRMAAEAKKLPFYKDMLRVAEKNGVPVELLLSIAHQESNFNPSAVSPKGARGLMQLMPETARQYGVKNPMDPLENIGGAARYLRHLSDKYKGNMTAVIAAYNEGETKFDRAGVGGGDAETRKYLANVGSEVLERTGRSATQVEPWGGLPKVQSRGDQVADEMAAGILKGAVGGLETVLGPVKNLLERIATTLERTNPPAANAQPLPIRR